jgi:hypothetical protein
MSAPMDPLLDSTHDQWRPLKTLGVTSEPGHRNPDTTHLVLRQFGLDTSARYAPREGLTFCNIFSWDFTRAMGCEIPHWWQPAEGARQELTANATLRLLRMGALPGWRACSPAAAWDHAALGQPVTVWWQNGYGSGHVAVLEPRAHNGDWRNGLVAQAGRVCGYEMPLAKAFGAQRLPLLYFFFHE